MAGKSLIERNPKLIKAFLDLVEQSGNYRFACSRINANSKQKLWPSIISKWKERGKKGEQPYQQFLERLTRVEDAWEADTWERIGEAQDWRALAWQMAAHNPTRYSQNRHKVEHSTATDEPLEIVVKFEDS